MALKQKTGSSDDAEYDFWYGVFGEPDSGLYLFGTPTGTQRRKSVCEHDSCTKTPSFSIVGTKPKRCGTHRLPGDVNVRHKLCSVEGCVVRARFGMHGTPATHCGKHRLDGSRNVSMRTCVFPGCTVSPSYGRGKYTNAERCALHKVEGDIVTSRETCSVERCVWRPCFVDNAGNKHCLEHHGPRTDVGILYLMCQEPGCKIHATFSESKNRPLWCLKHKRGMDRDVVHTMCEFESCVKRPSFAPMGSRAKRCKSHSVDGDVNV